MTFPTFGLVFFLLCSNYRWIRSYEVVLRVDALLREGPIPSAASALSREMVRVGMAISTRSHQPSHTVRSENISQFNTTQPENM